MKLPSQINNNSAASRIPYRRYQRHCSDNLSNSNKHNMNIDKTKFSKENCLRPTQSSPYSNVGRRLSWKYWLLMIGSLLWLPLCWMTIYFRYNIHDSSSSTTIPSNPNTLRKASEKKNSEEEIEESQMFLKYVKTIRTPLPVNEVSNQDLTYDIYNCPKEPPENYPLEWSLVEQVLEHWNPSSPHVPSDGIYQSLCVFTDKNQAEIYRKAEKPFILRDDPIILPTVHRWNYNHPSYLVKLLGRTQTYNVETSTSQHLMWFKDHHGHGSKIKDWKPPMEYKEMTYLQWLDKANVTLDYPAKNPHYYFRVNAKKSGHPLYKEMPWFEFSTEEKTYDPFYVVSPGNTRGINCRFGMVGNMAESHFDSSRNFIVLLGGKRRYILSHPKNCDKLELFPIGHPSARHSKVDWTLPAATIAEQYSTTMKQATANEVILQAGDVLYLPTYWFHTIISLNLNYQCNARSGYTYENHDHLIKCGFS